MKKNLIIIAVILMAGFALNLNAQTSATTDAGAKIVTALSVTSTANLHFGTMSIPTGAVNVVVGTDNSRSASAPANITLLAQTPTFTRAAYTVAGSANSTYAITLPADGTVTIVSGSNSMPVSTFKARATSTGAEGLTGTLNGAGADSFVVGATLVLASSQPFGIYSGTFNVSVNYN